MRRLRAFIISGLIPTVIMLAIPTASRSAEGLPEARFPPFEETELTREHIRLMGVDPDNPDLRVKMNLFRTMVRHPELLTAWRALGDRVSSLASMEDYDRELMIMRIAWLTNSEYEWAQHFSSATRAGLTADRLEALKAGASAPGWNDWEKTLLNTADQLHEDSFVSDTTYAALKERYTDQVIMDIVALVAHYQLVAMLTNTLGIQLDDHHEHGFE